MTYTIKVEHNGLHDIDVTDSTDLSNVPAGTFLITGHVGADGVPTHIGVTLTDPEGRFVIGFSGGAVVPADDGQDATAAAEPEPFDPAKHNVDQVLTHLAEADPEEQARVLAAEADGKGRATILHSEYGTDGARPE